MHYINVHMVDGREDAFRVEYKSLAQLIFDIETKTAPTILGMEHSSGSAEAYFPAARASAVAMPLIDVMDAIKFEEKELSAEDA